MMTGIMKENAIFTRNIP